MNFKHLFLILLLTCSLTSLRAMQKKESASEHECHTFKGLPAQSKGEDQMERIVCKRKMAVEAVPAIRAFAEVLVSNSNISESTKDFLRDLLKYANAKKPEATRTVIHQLIDERKFKSLPLFISIGANFDKKQRQEKYSPEEKLKALVGKGNIDGYKSCCYGWPASWFWDQTECIDINGLLEALDKRKEETK